MTVIRARKITLGQMRANGTRGLIVFCADHRCSHSIRLSADRWSDDVRLSDLEPLFRCRPAASAAPTPRPLYPRMPPP